MTPKNDDQDVVVIRRYGNRRLYDTRSSVYVNLADVRTLIQQGRRIRVVDAATEEDVTRRVLTQIVLEAAEEDDKGLPLELLYELARASDRAFRDFLDWYLKSSLEVYHRLQETWQADARRRFSEARPALEAWAQLWDPRQVAASLSQLWTPVDRRRASSPGSSQQSSSTPEEPAAHGDGEAASGPGEARSSRRSRGTAAETTSERGETAAPPPVNDELEELRRRLDQLERRLSRERDPSADTPSSTKRTRSKPGRS